MSKDRRLGRGLAALLGNPADEGMELPGQVHSSITDHGFSSPPPPPVPLTVADLAGDAASAGSGGLVQLDVFAIEDNPFQPRRDFSESEITSLAESLKEHDMLQPILVRMVHGRHQLISGERRLRAARQAGWKTVPARIREADDRLVAELAIVENLQRKDLNPLEKALSFKRYLDEHRSTQDELAKRLKIDRSTIANLMRLLELPDDVHKMISTNLITAGHARAMLPLGDEREQIDLGARIVRDGLSVRDVERIVNEKLADDEPKAVAGVISAAAGSAPKPKRTRSEQIALLEQEFKIALGAKVEIRTGAKGRGKLIVHFQSHDDFDRLRDHLTDAPTRPIRKAN